MAPTRALGRADWADFYYIPGAFASEKIAIPSAGRGCGRGVVLLECGSMTDRIEVIICIGTTCHLFGSSRLVGLERRLPEAWRGRVAV